MALSFEKVVTSSLFTFVVGAERTPITLHNALVAHHSSALNTMMNGAMSEAKANQADMLEIDVPTFVHFSQWLYTGRYDLPYCEGYSQMCLKREREPENRLLPWNHGLSAQVCRRKEKAMRANGTWEDRVTQEMVDAKVCSHLFYEPAHSSRKQSLWNTFIQPSDLFLSPPPRKGSQDMNMKWAEVLLGHSRLYCFADMYGIASLQKLCSDAVRAALIDLDCEGDQVDALVQLISYIMENTPATDLPDAQSLRAIVLHFAVIVFEVLVENESFKEFLRTQGDHVVELLGLLTKRLD